MKTDIQFKEAMLDMGLEAPAEVISDGNIHRFGKNKNSWYVLHNDSISAGAFGDWKTGLSGTWKENREYSPTEKAIYEQHMDAIIKQREAEKQKRQAEAKKACNEKWSMASATINHAYLDNKQVKSYGLKQLGDQLLIPVRKNKQLISLQSISPTGKKLFHTGGAVAGGYHVIEKPTDIILIGEGYATLASAYEATQYCSVVAFNAGNLKVVAENIRGKFPKAVILILAEDDRWTDGNPGLSKAKEAASSVGAYVCIPVFKDISNKPTDFNDLHCMEGLETVKQQIENTLNNELEEVKELPEERIQRLSKLSLFDFTTTKKNEAKKLDISVGDLTKLVNEAKKVSEQNNDEVVTSDEPFQGEVNGQQLLDEIQVLISRHMILPHGTLPAISLWIVATYVYNDFRIFPKLSIISPEKRCGKSTLLDIISGLCSRSLLAANITPPAIFRVIEALRPSLLIDEADTFIAGRNDDMIGIINSGHTKNTAKVVRLVGDNHEPKVFNTFCPMALASIKNLPGTVMDRSIAINLRRRMAGEKVERLSIDCAVPLYHLELASTYLIRNKQPCFTL